MEALKSISGQILVPDAFMPLISDDPVRSIQFKQTVTKGIALYENEDPIGILRVGVAKNKDNGIRVVVSGEYELIYPGSPIRFDYRRIGTKEPVRTQIGESNFMFVRKMRMAEKDFRKGPWGYAFYLAE